MTTAQLYLKYSGSEVSNVMNFKINNITDSRSSCSFEIANLYNKNYATWKARQDEYIEIWERSKTELVFAGWITKINSGNPILIQCDGYLGALSFHVLDEYNSNCVLDRGLIDSTLGTSTFCHDLDGNDPGFSNDQYNTSAAVPRYFVVSDSTKSDSTATKHPIAASHITGSGAQAAGTWAKTAAEDSDYWQIVGTTANTPDTFTVDLHFGIESENIPVLSKITSLNIKCKGKITNADSYAGNIEFCWYGVGTPSWKRVKILNYDSTTKVFNLDITIKGNEWFQLFTEGNDWWEDGVLNISVYNMWHLDAVNLYIDHAEITVTYVTASFDTINLKITDTVATNAIICGASELGSLGVSPNDSWAISVGVTEAIERSFSGFAVEDLNHEINSGTLIDKGATFNQMGARGIDMFIALCHQHNLRYFNSYKAVANTPYVIAIEEGNIAAATVTYDKDNDPPSELPKIEVSNDECGAVVVVYSNGMTAPIPAATPSSNKKVIPIINRNIVTLAEANALALREANLRNSAWYSVQLVWNYLPTNIPYIGTKYNLTIPVDTNADGIPEDTVSFTNILCRRVSIEQDGSHGAFKISAFFGNASTPADERMGKITASSQRRIDEMERLSLSTPFVPATRHSQLDGIAGSTNGYHISSGDYTKVSNNGNLTATSPLSVSASRQLLGGAAALSIQDGTTAQKGAVQLQDSIDATTTKAITPNAVKAKTDLLDALLTKLTYQFAASTNTTTAMVDNTFTKVPFEDEEYDPASLYNVDGTFTAPCAGVWHFDAHVTLTSSANWEVGEQARIALYKNGAVIKHGDQYFYEAAGTWYSIVSVSADIKLAQGDTVDVYIFQNSDANINVYGSNVHNYFNAHWSGDG